MLNLNWNILMKSNFMRLYTDEQGRGVMPLVYVALQSGFFCSWGQNVYHHRDTGDTKIYFFSFAEILRQMKRVNAAFSMNKERCFSLQGEVVFSIAVSFPRRSLFKPEADGEKRKTLFAVCVSVV